MSKKRAQVIDKVEGPRSEWVVNRRVKVEVEDRVRQAQISSYNVTLILIETDVRCGNNNEEVAGPISKRIPPNSLMTNPTSCGRIRSNVVCFVSRSREKESDVRREALSAA